jgi:hypothetical protein
MKFIFSFILFCLVLIPSITWADEPVNNFLVGIPGIGSPSGDFDGYIQAIYAMFISIAALLAVVKIIIAGVKYMFTDIVPQKTQAKKDIQGALLGLVVVLGAVLILTVINPELTNFNIEQNRISTPPPQPDVTMDEFEQILSYCEQQPESCSSSTCDYLATDYFLTWMINNPLNNIACNAFCSGIVVADSCIYPTDEGAYRDQILSMVSTNFSEGDEIVRIGTGEGLYGTDFINTIVTVEDCFDSFGQPQTHNEEEICVIDKESRVAALPGIASENCPVDKTCEASLCVEEDRGMFESCEEQCSATNNTVYYDTNARACVLDLFEATNTINFSPGTDYFLKQNVDQIAGGFTPEQVLGAFPSENGDPAYIQVDLVGGERRTVTCNSVEPSLCVVNF